MASLLIVARGNRSYYVIGTFKGPKLKHMKEKNILYIPTPKFQKCMLHVYRCENTIYLVRSSNDVYFSSYLACLGSRCFPRNSVSVAPR